jgi:cytoskeleton protein RodZ
MQSLGVKLRLERERQKLGIAKIAEETRISQRYLEAIEADDQSSLPGEFFYRAFVRQYSKYLGWNPDEVDSQINMVSSAPATESIAPPAATTSALNLTREQQISALRESLKDKPMRPPQDDGMSKSWLVFAAVVILGCVVYFAWDSFMPAPQIAKVEAPPPVQPQVSTPAPEVKPLPPPTETQAPPPPVQPAPTGTFALTIRAKETTWIRLTADGAKIYGGTLYAGQERTLNAVNAELIVGNAGTLDVIYNGKPLTYGTKGEVKTLLLNPEGWKYKPKPAPEPAATPASTTGSGTVGAPAPGAF